MPISSSPAYKSHPIYFLRRLIIINGIIGLVLHIIACAISSYSSATWVFGILALLASVLLAAADLFVWAHNKHSEQVAKLERERACGICTVCRGQMQPEGFPPVEASTSGHNAGGMTMPTRPVDKDDDDDDKPKWPIRKIMILDFLLVGILFWMLICEIASVPGYYYSCSGPGVIIRAYASIPTLFAMILHARSWWRAFRAREKESWLRELGLRGHLHRGDIETGLAHTADDLNDSDRALPTNVVNSLRNQSVSFRDLVSETVHDLNREARRAVASRAWLGPLNSTTGRSDPKERESLLPQPRCPYHEPGLDINDAQKGCVDYLGRALWYGGVNSNANTAHGAVPPNETPRGQQSSHPIVIDANSSYLTPSDSGVTSASSSSDGSRQTHESNGAGSSTAGQHRENLGAAEIEDEGSASSTIIPANAAKPTMVEDDNDDDEDIMVVKKSKKGKANKDQKAKRRVVDIE